MSYDLHDYVSVIQFLTASCFALSFEKVLDFSSLGRIVSQYNTELISFYNQHLFDQSDKINKYKNIVSKFKEVEKLPRSCDGDKLLVTNCLAPYAWWFLTCSVLSFAVLFVADGTFEFASGCIWFWFGLSVSSMGVISWAALTVFKLLSFYVSLTYMRKTNTNIRISYGFPDQYGKTLLHALRVDDKDRLLDTKMDREQLIKKVDSYQLQRMDNFLGKWWFFARLWDHITRSQRYILPKKS
jgi:hypothetical protein